MGLSKHSVSFLSNLQLAQVLDFRRLRKEPNNAYVEARSLYWIAKAPIQ